MEETRIYVELSDDIRQWLADNGLSVADILEKKGIDAEVVSGAIPAGDEDGHRTRDFTSAGAAPARLGMGRLPAVVRPRQAL